MDINGLHELVGYLREDFKEFRKNEFHALEEKVDKISTKIGIIVGGIAVLVTVANILVRVLG